VSSRRETPVLEALVAASLLASGAHFAHNAIFLSSYPGPTWIPGPGFVVAAWLVVAFVLVRGYSWHRSRRPTLALAALSAYTLSCVLVFGHYLYGRPSTFDLLTNALIFLEGISGVALFSYYVLVVRHEAVHR
jgi:hypothetical protein